VLSVTDTEGATLSFETVGRNGDQATSAPAADRDTGRNGTDQAARVRVRLPEGVAVGREYTIYIHVVHTPAEWLSDWTSTRVEYPAFAVLGTARDLGAIAIQAAEDTTVYPDALEGLTPLDEGERAEYGLPGVTGCAGPAILAPREMGHNALQGKLLCCVSATQQARRSSVRIRREGVRLLGRRSRSATVTCAYDPDVSELIVPVEIIDLIHVQADVAFERA
jgi:hypothetical protein